MLNPSGEKTGNKKVDDMIEKKKQSFLKTEKTDSSQSSTDELGAFWTDELNRRRQSRQTLNASVLFAVFKLDVRLERL